jgi:hypothetical protein
MLRDVTEGDIPTFFEQQRDSAANDVAAFKAEDPEDWKAFTARWIRLLGDARIMKKTMLFEGNIAG